jgi:hypothetical protein
MKAIGQVNEACQGKSCPEGAPADEAADRRQG